MPDVSGGKVTPIGQAITGRFMTTTTASWFGPGLPIQPMAPPEVKGRQFDYGYGVNLSYSPRGEETIGFAELRALADNLPLLRAAIETRKDQLLNSSWTIKHRGADRMAPKKEKDADIKAIEDFLLFPDRENTFQTWIRAIVEEMLVTDAATIYPRLTVGGAIDGVKGVEDVFSLDLIDGATIKRLIDQGGRTPTPPEPAYQQILHGIPAADFTSDELMYLPRNRRVHKFYGFSPVEQIILTVNIALRRDVSTLEYYTAGTIPDQFITLPKEWTTEQVKQFQEYFDYLMAGNLAARRQARFMPGGSDTQFHETKAPPLKDMYDEWLGRIICWAFNVSVTPLVTHVNRATGETMRVQATEEGLHPTQDWLKSIFDIIIWKYFKRMDLEFAWENQDQTDILKLAQSREIYGKNGLLGYDEIREDMGRDQIGVGNVIITASGPIPLKEATDKALEDIKNPPPPPPQLMPPNPGSDAPANGDPSEGKTQEVGKSAAATFRQGQTHSRTEVRPSRDAQGAARLINRARIGTA